MSEDFYSVGIDVGTTTTQVVFSRIFLEKSGGFGSIPRVNITKKDVVFKSRIHFTPLVSRDVVDVARLKDILVEEYRKSSIDMQDVTTGAVIITGESARKENAQEVAQQLAEFAGDFVVCSAGPDYEAVLAGWGSGAGEISKRLAGNIVNFDIGGGTTNAAVFQNGTVMDAFAANIGGRLVRVDANGLIIYVSEKIRFLLESLGLKNVRVGQKADIAELGQLTACMADMFIQFAGEQALCAETHRLFIGHTATSLKIDHMMFSGGVAEYIYRKEDIDPEESLYIYGDIGPLLGASIRRILPTMLVALLNPLEKIRATVVGAGSYSTGISGSTVTIDNLILPVKNLPVIKVPYAEDLSTSLDMKIAAQARLYNGQQVAISICGIDSPGYVQIKKIAAGIINGLENDLNPIIVITECDCAKALGLVINNLLGSSRSVICLDRIHVENGDFIDIGRPISGVVPVIVKSLIFGD